MNKTITLPKSKVLILQRWLSAASVGFTGMLLVAWFCGIIPFNGNSTGVLTTWEHFLEFVYIGQKSFINVVCRVGFAFLYYFLGVKALIAWIGAVKKVKKWFSAKTDSEETRLATANCIYLFNVTVFKVLVLIIASFFVFNYPLNGGILAVLIVLFVFASLLNFAYSFYLTRNVFESIVVSASRLLLLVSVLLFCFGVAAVEVETVLKAFVNITTLFGIVEVPPAVCLDAFLQTLVVPIACIWIAMWLLRLGYLAFVDGEDVLPKAKKLMIKSIVITLVVVAVIGLVNGHKKGDAYFSLLLENVLMAAVPVLVFLAAGATKNIAPEVPVLDILSEEDNTVGVDCDEAQGEAVTEESETTNEENL